MSGWCPSSSVCGMAVGALLSSCPVQWCGPRPAHPAAVLASTAVRVVYCSLPGVWCVWVSVSVWCSCGGVSSVCSPLVVVVGGAVVVVGGMVGEGRQCY